MSLLNQLFNRGLQASKCKTCLTFAVSRIKLLQNKRDVQLKLMRKEIAQFLQTGQEAIARIRVEHVTREQNIWAAYEILEMFCEFVIARVPILESQRECPSELCEAVATIIFAAPRCSDLPDLLHVRNLFAAKYGKEFIAAASELRPDTSVNRTIVEKLSVSTPSPQVKLKLLKEIAREYNVEWDSSKTESELSRKPEDLLNGPKQIATLSQVSLEQNSGGCQPISENSFPSTNGKQREHGPQSPAYVAKSKTPFLSADTNNVGAVTDVRDTRSASNNNNNNNNVLERAQNAILAAERASASARAAAELVNVKFDSVKLLLEERNS